MSAKEKRRAPQLICGNCPDQLSLPFALWTRGAIRGLIRRECDIRLSIRGVGEYVARRAYERDGAAVKDWLSIEYTRIKARARRKSTEIGWGDETGVRSDESRHRGYAPPGQAPIVKSPVRRKVLSMNVAATNQGKVSFMIYPGRVES